MQAMLMLLQAATWEGCVATVFGLMQQWCPRWGHHWRHHQPLLVLAMASGLCAQK